MSTDKPPVSCWRSPAARGTHACGCVLAALLTTSFLALDLNDGAAILGLTVTSTDFDGDPTRWSGIGCGATQGLVDNIRITPPGFASWMETLHPSLVGGTNDDDDNDGIANAIEFAFGRDPLNPDPSSALPQPVFGLTAATVSYAPLATQPGILYQLDWSRNLTAWTTINGTRNGSLLEFTIPTEGEPSIFIRHRVRVGP